MKTILLILVLSLVVIGIGFFTRENYCDEDRYPYECGVQYDNMSNPVLYN